MTAPGPDIVEAAVVRFQDEPSIQAVLGAYQTGKPWLFAHSPYVNVEGTQSTAAIFSYAGGWAGANDYNTVRYPRLSLDIWADCLRDPLGNPTDFEEVHRRVMACWDAFDRLLHRPAQHVEYWGPVRTIGCTRIGEPTVGPIAEGDGMRRLHCFYGVTQA